jgi:hypothetical protein
MEKCTPSHCLATMRGIHIQTHGQQDDLKYLQNRGGSLKGKAYILIHYQKNLTGTIMK